MKDTEDIFEKLKAFSAFNFPGVYGTMFDILTKIDHNSKPKPKHNKYGISLVPVEINADYAKKWNDHNTDFVHVYKNGKKVSEQLYRIGGFGGLKDESYLAIIKYVEQYYDDTITTKKNMKRHLAAHWCIINKDGEEIVVMDEFKYPYLLGGLLYTVDNCYYNIETGEFIGKSYTHMNSNEFIFIDNAYDECKSRRGVICINKNTGNYIIYPKSFKKNK